MTVCSKHPDAKRLSKGPTKDRCAQCAIDVVDARRKAKKQALIDYKGGKCVICGYDRCNRALEFHHLDRSEKKFSLSWGRSYSLERLYEEVDKCVLLCSNCHMEVEDGVSNLPNLDTVSSDRVSRQAQRR